MSFSAHAWTPRAVLSLVVLQRASRHAQPLCSGAAMAAALGARRRSSAPFSRHLAVAPHRVVASPHSAMASPQPETNDGRSGTATGRQERHDGREAGRLAPPRHGRGVASPHIAMASLHRAMASPQPETDDGGRARRTGGRKGTAAPWPQPRPGRTRALAMAALGPCRGRAWRYFYLFSDRNRCGAFQNLGAAHFTP